MYLLHLMEYHQTMFPYRAMNRSQRQLYLLLLLPLDHPNHNRFVSVNRKRLKGPFVLVLTNIENAHSFLELNRNRHIVASSIVDFDTLSVESPVYTDTFRENLIFHDNLSLLYSRDAQHLYPNMLEMHAFVQEVV